MAYATKYHEDSDADDEFERSVMSPALPPDYEHSPTSSGPLSTEHTPTTFTHSRDSKSSPTGLLMEWTEEQVADFISDLGLEQYADTFAGMSCRRAALSMIVLTCQQRRSFRATCSQPSSMQS